jgi:hypothetical protein
VAGRRTLDAGRVCGLFAAFGPARKLTIALPFAGDVFIRCRAAQESEIRRATFASARAWPVAVLSAARIVAGFPEWRADP